MYTYNKNAWDLITKILSLHLSNMKNQFQYFYS